MLSWLAACEHFHPVTEATMACLTSGVIQEDWSIVQYNVQKYN
jgi:hypothetical protein